MKVVFLSILLITGYYLYWVVTPPFSDSRQFFYADHKISATVVVSGTRYPFSVESGLTVTEGLRRAGFHVGDHDMLFPSNDLPLLAGTAVYWQPARSVRIQADGIEQVVSVLSATSAAILTERDIALSDDDIVIPSRETTVAEGMDIIVTRVEIREETKKSKIAFSTEVREDSELSWRKRIVKQKGENGIKTTIYRVSYHNGKEVNRKMLSSEVTQEPVTEKVTQGTYVKTGKSHRGAASWYAWTGTMAAANPWLPKGSYVKVTNMENGKSVIVVINDRGPFAPGRIIDLDRVAFEKIASPGSGVINVKMEEIVN